MRLDVRRPLGLMFTAIGVILVVSGLHARAPLVLPTGAGMLAFGAGCLLLARKRPAGKGKRPGPTDDQR